MRRGEKLAGGRLSDLFYKTEFQELNRVSDIKQIFEYIH